MICDRLLNLVKNWYVKVQEETMAPARMVAFMEDHIATCDVCIDDPDIRSEADRITEIVLPPSKVPKQKTPKEEEPDPVEEVEATGESNNDIEEEEEIEPGIVEDESDI